MAKQLKLAIAGGEVAPEYLLGRVVFFSIPDENVPADELMREWATRGLDEDLMSDVRLPVHVFQSACSSVTRRTGGEDRIEVRTDEVEHTSDRCSYQITRAVWNVADRTIEHEKGLRLEFNKETQTIRSERLDHYDSDLEDLERQVRAHYDANLARVPASKIRTAVRLALVNRHAQNLRRRAGGVYFVPKEYVNGNGPESNEPVVVALSDVIETLYAGRGELHTLPCVNGEGERTMVRRHFALNVDQEAKALSLKILQRVQSGSERRVRSDFVTNAYNDRRKLLSQLEQFENLVGAQREDVAASLAELDEALEKLEELA